MERLGPWTSPPLPQPPWWRARPAPPQPTAWADPGDGDVEAPTAVPTPPNRAFNEGASVWVISMPTTAARGTRSDRPHDVLFVDPATRGIPVPRPSSKPSAPARAATRSPTAAQQRRPCLQASRVARALTRWLLGSVISRRDTCEDPSPVQATADHGEGAVAQPAPARTGHVGVARKLPHGHQPRSPGRRSRHGAAA